MLILRLTQPSLAGVGAGAELGNIKYEELKIQDYLADGDRNISVSKIIFKARGKTKSTPSPRPKTGV